MLRSSLRSKRIYFDYNVPVITNTTVTEIIDFSESEIIKTNLCSVFPNPCKDVFTVKSENAICKIVVENYLG